MLIPKVPPFLNPNDEIGKDPLASPSILSLCMRP